MSSFTPEESPHWSERQKYVGVDTRDALPDQFPYNEGYPRTRAERGATYEILLTDGKVLKARVDLSTQYRAEGPTWEVIERTDIRYPASFIVMAWRRIA